MYQRPFFRISAALLLASLAFLRLAPLFFTPAAAADPIREIDIGIRPSAFDRLTSNEEEPVVRVLLKGSGGERCGAKLSLRGAASKGIGLMSPAKRVPLELSPARADAVSENLSNTSIKLINAYTPHRLLGECLALMMYEALGIPTPAHELLFLRFNGVDFGLYLASEAVNETFLEKTFPDGAGSLYKADYEIRGGGYSVSSWFGALRPVADRGGERLAALIDALNRREGYEAYLDVDEVLRYFACLAVWGANGSFLTEGSNFYLCDNGERFILIPWDSSEAFAAYPTENGLGHYQMEQWEEDYSPPLFTLLTEKEAYRDRYLGYVRQLNDAFLSPERLDPLFNRLAGQIRPYLLRDSSMFFNKPYSLPAQPEENSYGTIGALLSILHRIHENLNDQLAGKTDVFYSVSAYPEGYDFTEDLDTIAAYFASNSPLLDPELPEKIRAAYPAWCRENGMLPLDADDPAEIAVSAAALTLAFAAAALFGRRGKRGKKGR